MKHGVYVRVDGNVKLYSLTYSLTC